ncbi:hypothetical protein HMPREF9080_00684 [Cardiobacterium valvarum F0432]|uniref:Uncharacterized protein n=1 Tax=Cardiobacterium valvarum F0432 TaxID=797473 RepID=G9ZD50_9GAMM|nr:hypothetical protein HMPREF9080_00684 [Cardiobacterium valvarum F0432]
MGDSARNGSGYPSSPFLLPKKKAKFHEDFYPFCDSKRTSFAMSLLEKKELKKPPDSVI